MTEPSAPLPYNPAAAEKKWQSQWEKWGIYRWDSGQPREKSFVIDTPPPTVSGSLHIGHVFSYTHQDLMARFNRMRGRNIFYPMGWDDNGLPTERRVENFFNVRCNPALPYVPNFVPKQDSKNPPEIISRKNFIELCLKVTETDEKAFKELWQRIGLSVDWTLEYATINDHCRRISQRGFLHLFEEGEVYASHSPIMWDTGFRTAVAQAEIEDREVTGAFHTIKFTSEEGETLPIATTRPELLAACVAVVVHPNDSRYKKLVGRKAVTPLFEVEVQIYADEHVDPEKGTGIVMICTFGDMTDVEWWRQFKLPFRQVITLNGRMRETEWKEAGWEARWKARNENKAREIYSRLIGLDLNKARAKTVEILREKNLLIGESKPITHAVKFYEKGSQPLEILPVRQWYVKLLDHRDELVKQGEKIQWHPSFMLDRYKTWVQGLNQDWCVSRQRHFGVPFPIWYPVNSAGEPEMEKPILAKVENLPVDPMVDAPPGYEISQRGKPGGFIGESDVMDTWATSSLTPQIASGWIFDKERHAKVFPMDVRPQAHEIIRTWAFYTITQAWLHDKEIPWKNVLISGWILDPDRKKMSKSKGNVVTPLSLLETYSSDAVRYWASRARAGVDTTYDEGVFKVGKRLVTKLFNASKFTLDRIAAVENTQKMPGTFSSKGARHLSEIQCELDRGFAKRLGEIVTQTTKSFESYDWADALQLTESFFWTEFCDDYLELVKGRAYGAPDDPKTRSACATLKLTLSALLRLFAPFLPFITEEIWSSAFAGEGKPRSIHTSPWPSAEEFKSAAAPAKSDSYQWARNVLAEIRKEKAKAKVSLRWNVEVLEFQAPKSAIESVDLIKEEVISAGAVQKFVPIPKYGEPLIRIELQKVPGP